MLKFIFLYDRLQVTVYAETFEIAVEKATVIIKESHHIDKDKSLTLACVEEQLEVGE